VNRVLFHTTEDALAAEPIVLEHFSRGGIIAYPTETIYGLGCALEAAPLEKLVALKGRDATKSFIVLHANPMRMPGLTWTPAAHLLATRYWPGPLTIAVRADATIYRSPVLSEQGTVALRRTPLAHLNALLAELAMPITSTSANLSGTPAATTADQVAAAFADADVDLLILDGGSTGASQPSTVIDCAGSVPRLLREGAVAAGTLRATLSEGGFSLDV
jgi:L-threonylcarbamoyladenylate synthase